MTNRIITIRKVNMLDRPARPDTVPTRFAGVATISADYSWADIDLSPGARSSDLNQLMSILEGYDFKELPLINGRWTVLVPYPSRNYGGDDVIICANTTCIDMYHLGHAHDTSSYAHRAMAHEMQGQWHVSVEQFDDAPWKVCGELIDDRDSSEALDFANLVVQAAHFATELNEEANQ